MKIAIIDPVGIKAGLDYYDTSLARSLIEQGGVVSIYSNFNFADNSLNVVKSFSISFNKIRSALNSIISFYSSLRNARKSKTEIVILHLFHSSVIDIFFIRLVKKAGLRLCLIVHDVESFVFGKSSRLNACATIADHVIVHNQFTREELFKLVDVNNREKVAVIPHGNFLDLPKEISAEEVRTKLVPDDRKYLLFFGMIKKSKGLDVLIKAMKSIDKDVNLIIAGRTRDIDISSIREMLKTEGLDGRVKIHEGYVSNADRNILFKNAAALVLPYRKIYQSAVMLMAMSYGIPVIASDLTANKETIEDGSNGILFITDNADDLSEKINWLMKDEKLSARIGLAGKETVAVRNDWKMIGREFLKVLSK